MKATTLLREQHRRLEQLLDGVAQERRARLSLMLRLVEELMTHLSIEDTFLLGPLHDAVNIPVERYRKDQASVRNAVLQAVFVEDDEELFQVRLRELATAFEGHSTVIERDLLPIIELKLGGAQLEDIGARMQTYWDEVVAREGVDSELRGGSWSHTHAAE